MNNRQRRELAKQRERKLYAGLALMGCVAWYVFGFAKALALVGAVWAGILMLLAMRRL